MKGFKTEIENEAVTNTNFRKVLYTSNYCQLVLMSLQPNEEIGMETHQSNDQFFRVEKGHGKCLIDGNEYELNDGDAVVIPSGAKHNIINLSETEDLKLYTIYSPPHHQDGIIRATKAEAEDEENGEEFDGVTTEINSTNTLNNEISKLKNKVTDKIDSIKTKRANQKLVKETKK